MIFPTHHCTRRYTCKAGRTPVVYLFIELIETLMTEITIPYRSLYYSDVIMSATASQSISLTMNYSTVYIFKCRPKKTSNLLVTGFWEGNSPVTGEFPTQRASNAEMFSFDDVIMGTVVKMVETLVSYQFWCHTQSHRTRLSIWKGTQHKLVFLCIRRMPWIYKWQVW